MVREIRTVIFFFFFLGEGNDRKKKQKGTFWYNEWLNRLNECILHFLKPIELHT